MLLNVVVLPAPLGPRRANTVFFPTLKLMSSTTLLVPKVLETLRTRRRSSEFEAASAAIATSSLEPYALKKTLFMTRALRGRIVPDSHQMITATSKKQ